LELELELKWEWEFELELVRSKLKVVSASAIISASLKAGAVLALKRMNQSDNLQLLGNIKKVFLAEGKEGEKTANCQLGVLAKIIEFNQV